MRMRVAASVALTTLLAGCLAACAFVTPQQTARSYTPSDGVNGRVGSVSIRNVFLVTADGSSGNLIGVLSNRTDESATVTLQYAAGGGQQTVDVTVPADSLVSLRPGAASTSGAGGSSTQQVTLDGIDATRGGLFPVGFSEGTGEPVDLDVPVLANSLSAYATLTPTPSPTPSPTRTRRSSTTRPAATPEPSETPAG